MHYYPNPYYNQSFLLFDWLYCTTSGTLEQVFSRIFLQFISPPKEVGEFLLYLVKILLLFYCIKLRVVTKEVKYWERTSRSIVWYRPLKAKTDKTGGRWAEFIATSAGFGYIMVEAQGRLQTEKVLAYMVIAGLIGFLIDTILVLCERVLLTQTSHTNQVYCTLKIQYFSQ